MTAPDLTEARDLAAMWQARSEAAEAIAAKLARDVWAAIGLRAIDAGGGRTTKNTRATEFGMELGRNLWGGL